MLTSLRKIVLKLFLALLFVASFAASGQAQVYQVGIRSENRFTIANDDGSYTGFEAELWKEIAEQLHIDYRFQEVDSSPALLQRLKIGELDFGIGMLAMDYKSSEYVRFTYPYFVSNLAILSPAKGHTFGKLIRPIFKPIVGRMFIMIFIIMFVFGNILWFTEQGPNSIISKKYFPGIFEAMWCTFAIQSTIGFGDIIPKRWIARVVSIPIWICGLLVVAVITAQLLANYSNEQLHSPFRDYRDLSGKVVASVAGTVAAETLEDLGVRKLLTVPRAADLKALYPRLEKGEIDAIVFDYPFLADLAATLQKENKHPFLIVDRFHQQFYSIAMNKKLAEEHRELFININLKILQLRDEGFLQELHEKWFGNIDVQQ